MATRREVLIGGTSLVAVAACNKVAPVSTTGDTGEPDTHTTDTQTTPHDSGTTVDTQTTPHDSGTTAACQESSTDTEVVLCLDEHAALQNVDGSQIINSKAGQIIVVRTSQQQAIACSAVCTHLGCLVKWQNNLLFCPCHGSEFDTDGSVIRGPASRPLPSYEATLDSNADSITVKL